MYISLFNLREFQGKTLNRIALNLSGICTESDEDDDDDDPPLMILKYTHALWKFERLLGESQGCAVMLPKVSDYDTNISNHMQARCYWIHLHQGKAI